MSIYTGLEATIKLLRDRISKNMLIQDRLIEESLAKSARIDSLMGENEVMSDRIHLDLGPRIERLTNANEVLNLKLASRNKVVIEQDNKLEAIRLIA